MPTTPPVTTLPSGHAPTATTTPAATTAADSAAPTAGASRAQGPECRTVQPNQARARAAVAVAARAWSLTYCTVILHRQAKSAQSGRQRTVSMQVREGFRYLVGDAARSRYLPGTATRARCSTTAATVASASSTLLWPASSSTSRLPG